MKIYVVHLNYYNIFESVNSMNCRFTSCDFNNYFTFNFNFCRRKNYIL